MQTHIVVMMSSIGMLAIGCGGGTEDPIGSTQSSALFQRLWALAVVPNLTPTPTFSDSTIP